MIDHTISVRLSLFTFIQNALMTFFLMCTFSFYTLLGYGFYLVFFQIQQVPFQIWMGIFFLFFLTDLAKYTAFQRKNGVGALHYESVFLQIFRSAWTLLFFFLAHLWMLLSKFVFLSSKKKKWAICILDILFRQQSPIKLAILLELVWEKRKMERKKNKVKLYELKNKDEDLEDDSTKEKEEVKILVEIMSAITMLLKLKLLRHIKTVKEDGTLIVSIQLSKKGINFMNGFPQERLED